MLKSDYGTLLLPIADKLFITINDSVIQTV